MEKKDICVFTKQRGQYRNNENFEVRNEVSLCLTLSVAFAVAKQDSKAAFFSCVNEVQLPVCLLMLCFCTRREVVPCLRPSPREGLVSSRIPRPAAALLLRMDVLLVRCFLPWSVSAAQLRLRSRPPSRRPCNYAEGPRTSYFMSDIGCQQRRGIGSDVAQGASKPQEADHLGYYSQAFDKDVPRIALPYCLV